MIKRVVLSTQAQAELATIDRAISLREAALLQSFPGSYTFVKKNDEVKIGALARHIGNAVPPKLGEAIALSILQHLTKIRSYGRQAEMAL